MKKIISILLFVLTLFIFIGCNGSERNRKINFYYPKITYDYRSEIIGTERASLSNETDYRKVIETYLKGPTDVQLHCPLSQQTELTHTHFENKTLTLQFTDSITNINPTSLISALAALSKTCFEFMDVNIIQICAESVLINGEQKIVITKDTVLLLDNHVHSTVPDVTTVTGE